MLGIYSIDSLLVLFTLEWVAPPILTAIWARPEEGFGEEQHIYFCFRFLREPITKLALTAGSLLAGLTQWRHLSDGKQPIAYRVIWTRPIDHASG